MCDTCGCNVTPGNEHLVAADPAVGIAVLAGHGDDAGDQHEGCQRTQAQRRREPRRLGGLDHPVHPNPTRSRRRFAASGLSLRGPRPAPR